MALPRVDAVLRSSPVHPPRPQGGTAVPALLPGSTLRLSMQQASGDDLLTLGPDGVAMRLPGLAHLAERLAAGDMLMMRVVSAGPKLELALIEALARAHPAGPGWSQNSRWAEPPALQFDQLAFRHAARASGAAAAEPSLPPGTALAASWRAQVLALLLGPAVATNEAARERSTLAPPRRSLALPAQAAPARAAQAANNPPGAPASPGSQPAPWLQPPPGAERWLFHIHTAHGLPLQLRLVAGAGEGEGEQAASSAAQEQGSGAVALRLDLLLPHLGRIALRLRSVNGGIALILVLAADGAVPPVRAALPGLALALVRARISLRSCRLLREPALTGDRALAGELHAAGPRIAVALPPALFRAAAETVLALVAADAAAAP